MTLELAIILISVAAMLWISTAVMFWLLGGLMAKAKVKVLELRFRQLFEQFDKAITCDP